MKPTPRQRETLRLIARLTDDNGYPPTWAEMAGQLGIRPSAVHDRLKVLKSKDLVTWIAGRARTLRITTAGAAYV